MLLNASNLRTVFTGFNAAFQGGLGSAPTDHESFVFNTNSTTGTEEYPWLGDIPGMKRWVGDRVVNNLREFGLRVTNVSFEDTVAVKRTAIEDDTYGTYAPRMTMLGQAAARHPCQISYAALLDGFTTLGYDGQPLFSAAHPVLDANGSMTAVSNLQAGGGQPWFLIASGEMLKPILLQKRQAPRFVSLDQATDDNVFWRDELVYGVDDRKAAVPCMWQTVYASRQPLTPANYALARAAIMAFRGDWGKPLGLKPDLLLVNGVNESPGLKVVKNDYGPGGESNDWQGTARLQVSAWF